MINIPWASFKNDHLTPKGLLLQYFEFETYFQLLAFDGPLTIYCKIPKDTEDADYVDFNTNYKSTSNQKIGMEITKLASPQPFALPAYRTKLNATEEKVTITPDTLQNVDFLMVNERYVTGGTLTVKNAKMGDYITASVIDNDSIIPSPYRAALCEAHPIVATYIEKHFIEVEGEYTNMKIDTYPLNAKITPGLYLRITYHSTEEEGDREVTVNYKLTKKL